MKPYMFDNYSEYNITESRGTVKQECLAVGKFGEFGKLSVIRQTFTTQILAYK